MALNCCVNDKQAKLAADSLKESQKALSSSTGEFSCKTFFLGNFSIFFLVLGYPTVSPA